MTWKLADVSDTGLKGTDIKEARDRLDCAGIRPCLRGQLVRGGCVFSAPRTAAAAHCGRFPRTVCRGSPRWHLRFAESEVSSLPQRRASCHAVGLCGACACRDVPSAPALRTCSPVLCCYPFSLLWDSDPYVLGSQKPARLHRAPPCPLPHGPSPCSPAVLLNAPPCGPSQCPPRPLSAAAPCSGCGSSLSVCGII